MKEKINLEDSLLREGNSLESPLKLDKNDSQPVQNAAPLKIPVVESKEEEKIITPVAMTEE